jgi:hypothetical protein
MGGPQSQFGQSGEENLLALPHINVTKRNNIVYKYASQNTSKLDNLTPF